MKYLFKLLAVMSLIFAGIGVLYATDAATLYTSDCSGCHGPLASSSKKGRTAAQIQSAINSIGAMSSLSGLTTADISAIAAALAPPPPPAPVPVSDMMPEPNDRNSFFYEAAVFPAVNNNPSTSMPIGVGPVAAGGSMISIQATLGQFVSPMDVYVAYSIPVDPDMIYFMRSDYSVVSYTLDEVIQAMGQNRFPAGVEPWKRSSTGLINEIILNNIPISEADPGTYAYYLLASPAGQLDRYYLWGTWFNLDETLSKDQPQIAEPDNTYDYFYEAPVFPAVTNDPATSMPIGVGPVAAGGNMISIQAALGKFVNPMDVYVAYSIPVNPDMIHFMKADYSIVSYTLNEVIQAMGQNRFPAGVEPWKSSSTGPINEIILNNIPSSEANAGTYAYYLLASPAGRLDRYYLWGTEFGINGSAQSAVDPLAPPAPATDGISLYNQNCAICHGSFASSPKAGRTAAQIQSAIGNIGVMSGLNSLTSAQISAIAGALAISTPPPPTTTDGTTLYANNCAGCHGALASSAKRGRTAAQIQSAINSVGVMSGLRSLTSAQISAIAGVLATSTPPPITSNHPVNWYTAHRDYAESHGTSSCTACHGSTLRGGTGPSCYTCHGKVW